MAWRRGEGGREKGVGEGRKGGRRGGEGERKEKVEGEEREKPFDPCTWTCGYGMEERGERGRKGGGGREREEGRRGEREGGREEGRRGERYWRDSPTSPSSKGMRL